MKVLQSMKPHLFSLSFVILFLLLLISSMFSIPFTQRRKLATSFVSWALKSSNIRSMSSSFTLTGESMATYEVKKSTFIARAKNCATAKDAMSFLSSVRDDTAGHNCWAYFITTAELRYSDDGEPSGTAGRPILAAIEAEGLVSTMVVVSRYKNGPQLGTGGLARAYGAAARECLREAGKSPLRNRVNIQIACSSMDIGFLYQAIEAVGKKEPSGLIQKMDETFDAGSTARITFNLPTDLVEPLRLMANDLGKGRIQFL